MGGSFAIAVAPVAIPSQKEYVRIVEEGVPRRSHIIRDIVVGRGCLWQSLRPRPSWGVIIERLTPRTTGYLFNFPAFYGRDANLVTSRM